MKHGIKLTTHFRTTVSQILGTRLNNIIRLAERDFNQLVKDIEDNPLFEKLRSEKFVRYKRFPNTGFSHRFLELNENISADRTPVNVESILETKQDAAQIIKKIGIEKFKEHFLYNENNISGNEIAQKCGISIDEVKKIIELLDEVSVHSEFYNPSGIDVSSQIRYHKIASIERDGKDGFTANFFSPNLAKGKYEIDYDRLEKIENRKIKAFVRKLELINIRKTTVYRVIERLILHQKEFLNNGDLEKRNLLTQKELSVEINTDPSIVCRIVMNRSVEIPSGREVPLKNFFSNRKNIRKLFVRKIIEKNKECLSAEKIKQIFEKDYRANISRRSIAYYMTELKGEK